MRIFRIACLTAAAAAATRVFAYSQLPRDRVLLMNDDTGRCAVTLQGYFATNTAADAYWVHEGITSRNVDFSQNRTLTLRNGTTHTYYEGDRTLWRLENCWAGTFYGTASTRNYLPWSATGVPLSGSSLTGTQAGSVVMRNIAGASITSPFYEDGIGTLYFDAVNGWNNYLDSAITVQFTTNILQYASDGSAVRSPLTEDSAEDEIEWLDFPMNVFAVSNCSSMELLETGCTNIVLASTGGSSNYFYRVRGTLDTRQPARFRIVRPEAAASHAYSDGYCLLQIDSLFVSFPADGAELHSRGVYDTSREGTDVLGYENAFSTPFPSPTGDPLSVSVGVTYSTTNGATKIPELFNARLHYRWRYLSQVERSWATVQMKMNEEGDTLTVESPIAYDEELGVSDLEYYFDAEVYGDYFSYTFAMSGTRGLQWPDGFSEAKEKTSLFHSTDPSDVTEIGTTNMFLRLREGASDYRDVTFRASLNGIEQDPAHMELVADHRWRYYYKAGTNATDTARVLTFYFTFDGYTEPDADSVGTGSVRYAPADYGSMTVPYSGFARADDNTDHTGEITLDGASGYLMFEIDDRSGAFTVAHAEYQNFNMWHQALGSVYDGNMVSSQYVSSVKSAYTQNFSSESTASNRDDLWEETFNMFSSTRLIEFGKYFQTDLTPNGWDAGQGLYVREKRDKRYVPSNTSTTGDVAMALEMLGSGLGYLSYTGSTNSLEGIDTVKFSARLSQALEMRDFAVYEGGTELSNYGFTAQAQMSQRGGNDMSPVHPSMSLVAYYRQNVGCYEFRVTRSSDDGITAALYRWSANDGVIEPVCLTNWVTSVEGTNTPNQQAPDGTKFTNTLVANTAFSESVATTMYITCTNVPYVYPGTSITTEVTRVSCGVAKSAGARTAYNKSFLVLQYDDGDSQLRHSRGTYGLGMTDCNGAFLLPCYGTNLTDTGLSLSDVKSEDTDLQHLSADGSVNQWSVPIGRLTVKSLGVRAYFACDVQTQPVAIDIASQDGGSVAWQQVAATNVTSFANATFSIPLKKRGRYFMRLRHAAEWNAPRTDVTVDDVSMTSWCAKDSSSIQNMGAPDDWVYTQGWIEKSGGVSKLNLVPRRADPEKPCGVRSPLLEGASLFSFQYENANTNCTLRLQIATNAPDGRLTAQNDVLEYMTYGSTAFATNWVDVATFTFANSRSGTRYYVFNGYRAPKDACVRLILDPSIVSNAEKNVSAENAGITITSVSVLDEPEPDIMSWTGWNMLTTTNTASAYMPDASVRPFPGLSAALNYAKDRTVKRYGTQGLEHYELNDPHIQTPVGTNGLGYVMFRARKLDASASNTNPAYVSIYGSVSGGEYDDWENLADIEVSSRTFKNYSWRLQRSDKTYTAMRFAVKGIREDSEGNPVEEPASVPIQRVLLDEISVSETMRPELRFAKARPFRSHLSEDVIIENLLSSDEQPLAGESFGFQCELSIGQLADELDLDSVSVEMFYYPGTSPWGFSNWMGQPGSVRSELPATSSNLVFRSSYDKLASIVAPQQRQSASQPTVVQYAFVAHWKDKSGNEYEARLDSASQWTQPEWYYPLDLNEQYGGGTAFSAYTILDTVAPRRAWINCVNTFDSDDVYAVRREVPTNQFIELAVPAGIDMAGWYVRARTTARDDDKAILFRLGSFGVPASKADNSTNLYAFLTVQSPATAAAGGTADATWHEQVNLTRERATSYAITNGVIKYQYPLGFELIRPNGIIEHQITVDNFYNAYYEDFYPDETGAYLATNTLAASGASWFYAGCDTTGTLGVMDGHGASATDWETDLQPTPTAVNRRKDGTLQSVNADMRYLLPPNGTNHWIVLRVASDHLVQDVSGDTTASQMLIVPRGASTNVVYTADRYYMISSILTNGVPYDLSAVSPVREFDLRLDSVDSDMYIDAYADVSSVISGFFAGDSAEEEPYHPYVVKWLQDNYGDYEPEDIKLAGYYDLSFENKVRDLSLTEMYQLDINPVEQCRFVAGIGDPGNIGGPSAWPVYTKRGEIPVTNVQMTVFMMITNTVTGEAYPPHVLNGIAQNSRDFVADAGGAAWDSTSWTSVTFKVSCRLAEKVGTEEPGWVPLKWYFFDDDSFGAAGSDFPFRARLEVEDPFKPWSPAYSEGYRPEMEGRVLYFRWQIDHVRKPDTVHLMRPSP